MSYMYSYNLRENLLIISINYIRKQINNSKLRKN